MLNKNWMESRYTLGSLVARSAAMQRLVRQASLQTHSDASLLVVGDTGTGKSMLSRAIHNSSSRGPLPFVAVAAARLTPDACESILFGNAQGESGALARAAGGTLLLRDVEELGPVAQERISQLLSSAAFTTAAGERCTVNFRLMCTGHTGDLAERLARGMFSEELYSQLSSSVLTMPTLTERNADIPYLVSDILRNFAERERVSRPSVPYHYMELLTRVEWPENVQQLRNHVESVMALSDGRFDPAIVLAHFEETASPQSLKSLVQELLHKLVVAPQAAGASATN